MGRINDEQRTAAFKETYYYYLTTRCAINKVAVTLKFFRNEHPKLVTPPPEITHTTYQTR